MKTMAKKVTQGGGKGKQRGGPPSTPPTSSAQPVVSTSRRTTPSTTLALPEEEDHHSVVSCNIVEDTTGPRMNAAASSSSSAANINYMLNHMMMDNVVHTSSPNKRVVAAPSLPETPRRYHNYEKTEAYKTPLMGDDPADDYDHPAPAATRMNRGVACIMPYNIHNPPHDTLVTATTTIPASPLNMDLSAAYSCPESPLKYGALAAVATTSQQQHYQGPVDLDVTLSPEHSFESPGNNRLPALQQQGHNAAAADDDDDDDVDENEVMFRQLAMEKLSADSHYSNKGPVDLDETLSPENSFFLPPGNTGLLDPESDVDVEDDDIDDYILFQPSEDKSSSSMGKSSSVEEEVAFQHLSSDKSSSHDNNTTCDTKDDDEDAIFPSAAAPLLLFKDDSREEAVVNAGNNTNHSFEKGEPRIPTTQVVTTADSRLLKDESLEEEKLLKQLLTVEPRDEEQMRMALRGDGPTRTAKQQDVLEPLATMKDASLLVADDSGRDLLPVPIMLETEPVLKDQPRRNGETPSVPSAPIVVSEDEAFATPSEVPSDSAVVSEHEAFATPSVVPSDSAVVSEDEACQEEFESQDATLAEQFQKDTPATDNMDEGHFPDDEPPLFGELVEEQQIDSLSPSSPPLDLLETAEVCEKSTCSVDKDSEEQAQCTNAENIDFARDDAPGLSFTDEVEAMEDTIRFQGADLPQMANLAVQTNIFEQWRARESECQFRSDNYRVDAKTSTSSRGEVTNDTRGDSFATADDETFHDYALGEQREENVPRKEPSKQKVTIENKFGVSFMHGGDEVELELAPVDIAPIQASHVQNLAAAFERTSERVQEVSASSTPSTSRDLPNLSDSSADTSSSRDRNSIPSSPPKFSNDTMVTASSSSQEENFESSQTQDDSNLSCSYMLEPEKRLTDSSAQSGNEYSRAGLLGKQLNHGDILHQHTMGSPRYRTARTTGNPSSSPPASRRTTTKSSGGKPLVALKSGENFAENPAVHNHSLSSHKSSSSTVPDHSTSTMNRAYIKSEGSTSNDSSNQTNRSKGKTASFTFFHPEEESVGPFTALPGDSFAQAQVLTEENQSFTECFGNISAIETRPEQPSMLVSHLEGSSASFARRSSTTGATNVNESRDLSISRSLGSSDVSLNRSGNTGPRTMFALSTEASNVANTSNSIGSAAASLPDQSIDSSKCEQILLQSQVEAAAAGRLDLEKIAGGVGLDLELSMESTAPIKAPEKKRPPTPPRRKPEPIVVETVEEDSDDESWDGVSIADNTSAPAPIPIFDHLAEKRDAPGRTAAQATNQSSRRPSQTRHTAPARGQRAPQAETEPDPTLGELFDMVTETFSPWNIHHLFNDAPWPSDATSTTTPNKKATKQAESRQILQAVSSTLSEEDALTEMTAVECTLEEDHLGGKEGTQNYSADISSYDLSLSILEEEEDGQVFSTPPKAGSSTKHHGVSTDESPNGVLDFANHL